MHQNVWASCWAGLKPVLETHFMDVSRLSGNRYILRYTTKANIKKCGTRITNNLSIEPFHRENNNGSLSGRPESITTTYIQERDMPSC